ncbi:MAG: hypothetical protein EBV20_07080 [Betaproteobacteria bacterium]|jgi:hypothetical protein|nr:hypothetical protein [Betaproteobacteria bacterium]NBP45859.1 hypothetical protein [Betaproteobacteria bacterium]
MTHRPLKHDVTHWLVMLGLTLSWPAWSKTQHKQAPLLCQQGQRMVPCPDATQAEKPKGQRAEKPRPSQDSHDFKAQPSH